MKKYYIYNWFSLEDDYENVGEILEKIVSIGNGKYIDEDKDRVISEYERVEIDGNIIEASITLETFIGYYADNERTIPVEYGLEFELCEVAYILLDELNNTYKDSNKTYADIIFESDCPANQIETLLNELVDRQINTMMDVIKMSMDEIREKAKERKLEW